MSGIQDLPHQRIPEEWDNKWFLEFIRDVLINVDVRNALGVGITITGEPAETATLANDSIDNDFIMVTASENQDNERVLAVNGGLSLTDNGAGLTIVVSILANGIVFAKVQQIATSSFLGRSTAATGDIEVLTTAQATALLDAATVPLRGVVKQTAAVADLSQTITDPPTQAEVQAISDKIDEWLAKERTSGQQA